jgi:hypothetical protein
MYRANMNVVKRTKRTQTININSIYLNVKVIVDALVLKYVVLDETLII